MFRKPRAGWTDVTLGDVTVTAGYMTDIAMEFLMAAKRSLEDGIPFCLHLDCEGDGEAFIVAYPNNVFVIREDENGFNHINRVRMSYYSLIREGTKDIEKDIKDWAQFPCDYDEKFGDMRVAVMKTHILCIAVELEKLGVI